MKNIISLIKSNKVVIIVVSIILILVISVSLFNNKPKQTAVINTHTQTEIKLCDILNKIEGVGKADVMIKENGETIEGVVVVCRGGDNIMTRNDILNAVSTALNIDKNIIAIYAMC